MPAEYDVIIERAIAWARERLGSTDYAFRCLAFVEDAYEQTNQLELFGGDCAKASADDYEAAQNTGAPPAGAFVFYDCFGTLDDQYRNWGYVGPCLGGEQVIHAWDRVRIDNYLDVQDLVPAPGWTKPFYLGWTPVERLLNGHRRIVAKA
jgi:hypothetical protein